MLSYNQALDFIHGRNRFGTKLGLQNITKLLELLGNPHKDMKIIHVAGTNGKGSTCAIIDSLLRTAGFKVGLYTSPYLEVFNERMRVNGENISDDDLARLTDKVSKTIMYMRENSLGSPTEFEVVTAIGFLYFKEQEVDFLVLEVGMGGRLDATNVVKPLVSVITPISLDHQQYLGSTLRDIAREKCGIIKSGIPVVTALQEPEAMAIIEETCDLLECPLTKVINPGTVVSENEINYRLVSEDIDKTTFNLYTPKNTYPGLEIKLLGNHQLGNAATAVGAVEVAGIDIEKSDIYSGITAARWAGRLEILRENPTIIIDGAHNIAGIKTLKQTVERFFHDKKKILVLGILGDKDYKDMLKEIIPIADTIIATKPENPRALPAAELSEAIVEMKNPVNESVKVYAEEKIENAIKFAHSSAAQDDIIIFAGSLYMIGHVRTLLPKM